MLQISDKCYQLRFLTDIYEMTQSNKNLGYSFKVKPMICYPNRALRKISSLLIWQLTLMS